MPWAFISSALTSAQRARQAFCSSSGSLASGSGSRTQASPRFDFPELKVLLDFDAVLDRSGFELTLSQRQVGLERFEGPAAQPRPSGLPGRRTSPAASLQVVAGGEVAIDGLEIVA